MAKNSIGVFDSGVGGLTVVRSLMTRLPFESIVYFGDTARVPYGVKSTTTIEHFSAQITQFLLQQHVKMLVIACNTMAAVAVDRVRQLAGLVPVVDVISAGAKAAVASTQKGAIGVMATPVTIHSDAYTKAIHRLSPDSKVYLQACPLLVPLIEEGWLNHPATKLVIQEYLQSMDIKAIDTLLLGCTHYPLLTPLLQEMVGDHLQLIDSASTVAEAVAQTLKRDSLLNPTKKEPQHQFYVSDIPWRFRAIAERFLGCPLKNLEVIALD